MTVRGCHSVQKCSQNLAFARIARKNYTGARLLVFANFLLEFSLKCVLCRGGGGGAKTREIFVSESSNKK